MKYILIISALILTGCNPMSLTDVDSYKEYCVKKGGTPEYQLTRDNQVMTVYCKKDGVRFTINRKDVY